MTCTVSHSGSAVTDWRYILYYCNRIGQNRVKQVLARSQKLLMHTIPERGVARIQSQDLISWNGMQKEREGRVLPLLIK